MSSQINGMLRLRPGLKNKAATALSMTMGGYIVKNIPVSLSAIPPGLRDVVEDLVKKALLFDFVRPPCRDGLSALRVTIEWLE